MNQHSDPPLQISKPILGSTDQQLVSKRLSTNSFKERIRLIWIIKRKKLKKEWKKKQNPVQASLTEKFTKMLRDALTRKKKNKDKATLRHLLQI